MTWTTVNPLGPSQPVAAVLILAALLALGYALGLLYSVIRLREGQPIPPEGLEDEEEDGET